MKRILLLTSVLIIMFTSICFARIANSRVAIGGGYPGSSMNDFINMHGMPTGQNGRIYYYGESTSIVVNNENRIIEICTISKKFSTPDGVVSGMSENILNNVYGTADEIEQKDGMTIYKYYGNHIRLEFWVSEGTIYYIKIRG